MVKIALIGIAGLVAAGYFGLVPHSQATVALGAAGATVVMVWIGLFART
ncbi:MAG: hypothetical protein Q8O26_13490 [Phreatobacter sp.]|nr:hypothetical protein [Phreatobacter sp.]MDP2802888.1 hypothetical protein [Phreatobacter sp.]